MAGRVDVLVVGSGPAGAACAIELADRGCRVVLLTGGHRNSCWPELLSPAGAIALDRLGFSSDQLATVARPCQGIVDRWCPGRPVYTDFELLQFRHGWVVDRGVFDESLIRFAACRGVQVSHEPSFARLSDSPRNLNSVVTIRREGSAEEWTADFVVDATGAAGRLLPEGDNQRVRYDRLIAIRVGLSAPLDPPDWMHLATSASGWWYTLSPSSGLTQAVFMTDSDLLPRTQIARERHLAAEFRDAFPDAHSSPRFTEPVVSRDARTTCRRRIWTGRWLPIGDARMSLDPITGAGLERGLLFAEAGAELVAHFLTSRSFQRLEANAVNSLRDFQAVLVELRRRYTMAMDNTPRSTGPFWQRRRPIPGFHDSD